MNKVRKYKKIWLFGMDDYYPSGGMGDFKESFDTFEEAVSYMKKQIIEGREMDNYQVVDTESGFRENYEVRFNLDDLEEDEDFVRLNSKGNHEKFIYLVRY